MKTNLKPWLFGPNWEGQQCKAKTRTGTLCKRPAKLPAGRCRLHGGLSTGPKTADGLVRLVKAKTTHGKSTKLRRVAAKLRAEQGRRIRFEIKDIESWLVDHGHLEKNWRQRF